jgi:hypothetical protein
LGYALTGEAYRKLPLADAEATGQALATAINNNAPLAVQAATAQTQVWADRGEAAALAQSVPDTSACDAAQIDARCLKDDRHSFRQPNWRRP